MVHVGGAEIVIEKKITLLLLAEVVHPQPYKISGEFQYYVLYSCVL